MDTMHAFPPRFGKLAGSGIFLYLCVPLACFVCGGLVVWFLLNPAPAPVPPLPAEEVAVPVPVEEPAAPAIFRDNREEVLAGAAILAGSGVPGGLAPFRSLALAQAGEANQLWKLQVTESALPLDEKLLSKVFDGEPVGMLPSFRARGKKGQTPDLDDFNDVEALAFCDALIKANLTSQGAFANSSRSDLTFADLYNHPKMYRGEVIHQEGVLRRLRRTDPPANARARGVDHLYEGWVFDTRYGSNPVCFVFTELPVGLKVAEQLNRQVSFDAYYFKRYRYQSADSKPGYVREAPLFIGRSPVVAQEVATPLEPEWSSALLAGFLGLLLLTIVLALGLHGWFRRGDRQVRERLAAMRGRGGFDQE